MIIITSQVLRGELLLDLKINCNIYEYNFNYYHYLWAIVYRVKYQVLNKSTLDLFGTVCCMKINEETHLPEVFIKVGRTSIWPKRKINHVKHAVFLYGKPSTSYCRSGGHDEQGFHNSIKIEQYERTTPFSKYVYYRSVTWAIIAPSLLHVCLDSTEGSRLSNSHKFVYLMPQHCVRNTVRPD